ncbi:chorismate mutase [Buchnera aphidicola]|uniref:Bifunctional chorismate mutase/prephenate dehydratase n=1 Tax=Buchnera aphidicola (Lipaphis pseudobrassicae) TaxID=1258543 RepID=A0A4D6Y0F0_9GAMM|nr:chorismate mutase [Buchnera aphidicola]QCI22247.1 chorismate mutase [Buchnera aphidicola (Lipaphis pseudobrassicae)]
MPTNTSLLIFRNKINNIDEQIVKLLGERKKLVLKIAECKIENKKEIRDTEREKKMLQKLIFLGKENHLKEKYITQLFHIIIEESVSIQKKIINKFSDHQKLNISSFSFLGPKGSYSHIAACEYAHQNFQTCVIKECSTFEDVIISVEKNQSNYAVLPIENTCSGYINEVFHLLKKTNLFIVGEIYILINHCLLGIKKISLNTIKTIYSHPQPFQQCSKFIKQFPKWKIRYTKSTADAMKKVTQYNDITKVALGSEIGSTIYGLNILSKNLANKQKNITRFILLQKNPVEVSIKILSKTTLIFSTGKESGAFTKVLLILQENKIIIEKITSHTMYKNPWEEIFYIDIQANLSSHIIQSVIKKMGKITKFIKILGCYPCANITPIVP